jgi:hypothetical protein
LVHPDKHSRRPEPARVVRVHRLVPIVACVAPTIERAFEEVMTEFVLPGSDKVTTRSNMCLNDVRRVTTVGAIERAINAGRRA